MAVPEIWILEDTAEVIQTCELLLRPTYDLRIFTTIGAFRTAWRTANLPRPALLIADLMLPDGYFLDLLESAEWTENPLTPLLVTSGLIDIGPMRRCLAGGADDYIVKPFVGAELLVKIERGLASRHGSLPASDAVLVDALSRCVAHSGQVSCPLTSREMQIMTLMRESLDAPIKRTDIIRKVWGTTKVTRKCLDVHLSHLRVKVQAIGLEIKLVEGGDYQLVAVAAGKAS